VWLDKRGIAVAEIARDILGVDREGLERVDGDQNVADKRLQVTCFVFCDGVVRTTESRGGGDETRWRWDGVKRCAHRVDRAVKE
jgi:hypothetical protein